VGSTLARQGIAQQCPRGALAAQTERVLAEDPYSGHLFVFRGRRGDLLKIISLSCM
jgi:transposase